MADLNHFLYTEQQQNDFGADQEVAAVLGRCLGWYNIVFFPGSIPKVLIKYTTLINNSICLQLFVVCLAQ